MQLLTPITFGSRTAVNRVVIGPHVTNLGDDRRSIPERSRIHSSEVARLASNSAFSTTRSGR